MNNSECLADVRKHLTKYKLLTFHQDLGCLNEYTADVSEWVPSLPQEDTAKTLIMQLHAQSGKSMPVWFKCIL